MRSISVEARIVLLVVGLSVLWGVVGSWTVGDLFERHVERSASETLSRGAVDFAVQERGEIEKLSSTLDALLACEQMSGAFVARDRARLLALAQPRFERMRERDRITHWYFIEAPPSKRVFLRVHRPELHSDVVDRTTFAQAIASGDVGAGKELGQTAFALRVVRPWFRDGKLIGYMELAQEIDHFLRAMKARTGDDYGILVKKQYLDERAWSQILGERANTWNDRPDVVVVDTTIFNLGIADFQGDLAEVPEHGLSLGEIEVDGKAWIRGLYPLRDAAGRKVGGLFVLHDFTPLHSAIRAGLLRTFFVLVALALLAATLILVALRVIVFRRLARMRARLESAVDAAGIPHERVLEVGPQDSFARLEALMDRLLRASSQGPRR